jgi:undecaprenyl-diphosphatase
MNIIEAVILGIIQGVTEFLPVSSSGHLTIIQKLFGIDEPVMLFNIALHLGTLLAVIVVLRKDIINIICKPVQKLTGMLIVSTLITVVFALVLKKSGENGFSLLDTAYTSTKFLGVAFLITSAALFVAEKLSKHGEVRGEKEANILDAVVIGICQGFGVLPGISRSGSTLAGALGRHLDRDFAARYSFLLSIPTILGGFVLEIADSLKPDAVAPDINLSAILAGSITAAIVGFAAINLMLKIIRSRKLYGFSIYTGILGILVIIFL